ncbi:ScbR family autoregulator-binding transcription factor [Micromonospora sp. KC723]|uniref:ScbR family autoregulator-binding transcription factor n=1 Tax=Micromonospora sp. KC723 TaxID=2530381 RepID=UPI0010455B48|nr:ScbR family autoregulator-binding transcription factor [Micromonospora sp. KC723]TDB78134.1 TetR/AcrR family transcriptional regulator [Micromonospora sp. KC723]
MRQARAEHTRESIVRAAAEMFDRYGYGATTLGDIITHAGVTKGALYFHFASKEELAQAVVQEQHQIWIQLARDVAARNSPPLEALISMSYGLAAQLRDHSVVRGGIRLTLESGTFQRPRPDLYLDWIAITSELLERAAARREIQAAVRPTQVAQVVVSSFTGLHLVTQVLDERRGFVERLADMWRAILPGLVTARKLQYYLTYVESAHRQIRGATGDEAPSPG